MYDKLSLSRQYLKKTFSRKICNISQHIQNKNNKLTPYQSTGSLGGGTSLRGNKWSKELGLGVYASARQNKGKKNNLRRFMESEMPCH